MKKTHIAALIMMLAAAVILIMSSKNLSTYATFTSAGQSEARVKVVGQLSLEDPMTYDPEKDANYFTFFMKDEEDQKRKVVLREPKPRDFERSEEIVVTGRMNDQDEFEADEILLKCPSKYKEEELALRKSG